jgi:hypothetical protein
MSVPNRDNLSERGWGFTQLLGWSMLVPMASRRRSGGGQDPGRRPRYASLPIIGEPMAPWLAGAIVIGVANAAMLVRGDHIPALAQAVLALGFGAALATAGLVSARSNRRLQAATLEERARPASEELEGGRSDVTLSYVEGMRDWAKAVLELIEHGISVTEPGSVAHQELRTAAADTKDLCDLMDAGASSGAGLNDQARLHALGSLWETSQERIERIVADADPTWHRRWRAGSVVERQLRHGQDVNRPFVPPYT